MTTQRRAVSRILAVLLAVVLLVSALPMAVFAQDSPVGLTTEARNLRPRPRLTVATFFAELTETNALTLEYSL